MKPRGRPKKNGGLCAKCGKQERISWSKSYCKQCAVQFNVKHNRKRLQASLEAGERYEVCLGCKTLKLMYPPQPGYCRDCFKLFAKKHERLARHRKWKWLRSLKEGRPCTDCDKVYPFYVMQWDHCRGTKQFNLGSAARLSYKRILEEIEKCDLVCANCHAIRTYQRKVEDGTALGFA